MNWSFDFEFPLTGGDALPGRSWTLIFTSLVVAFVILVLPLPFFLTEFGQLVPALVFPTLPLATLAFVSGSRWRGLFRRLRLVDFARMLGYALLYILAAGSLAIALKPFIAVAPNPAGNLLLDASARGRVLFFVRMVPQIFGEELITILPLLAIYSLLGDRLRLEKRTAIGVAWFLSSLWFGALHLPTYGFHVVQALVIIGSARVALTLAYLRSKNLLVATGAHLCGDWLLLGAFLLFGDRV